MDKKIPRRPIDGGEDRPPGVPSKESNDETDVTAINTKQQKNTVLTRV